MLVEVYERFEQAAQDKGVLLSLHLPEDILPRCRIDSDRFEQALSILVDNAICYTPQGGAAHGLRRAAGTHGLGSGQRRGDSHRAQAIHL